MDNNRLQIPDPVPELPVRICANSSTPKRATKPVRLGCQHSRQTRVLCIHKEASDRIEPPSLPADSSSWNCCLCPARAERSCFGNRDIGLGRKALDLKAEDADLIHYCQLGKMGVD